jgi:outer membrane receptor protein involved in Fe transport
MEEDILLGDEVVVSASRLEENILNSPVSIEKIDFRDIQQSSKMDFYSAIQELKGVDVVTSSIGFQVYNSRGFFTTGNERFVQMVDGMDMQAPGLNFPISNLIGPSDLDLETIEFMPGAASALYGPNAFNGILLMKTQDPFYFQGLSAQVKAGMNHFGQSGINPQPLYDVGFRFAKAFNNKFAFKVNFSYMQAEDWYARDYRDTNPENQGELGVNPGFNGLHTYGDEAGTNLALLRTNPAIRDNVAGLLFQSNPGAFNNSFPLAQVFAGAFTSQLPIIQVNRTPYLEEDLVDETVKNLKANAQLRYRLNNKLEAIYQLQYGSGTSVYTGSNRYSLNNFLIHQHKLELQSSRFFLRAYTTQERSGQSYDVTFNALNINNEWRDNSTWFGTYATLYALGTMEASGGNPGLVGQLPANVLTQIHQQARNFADDGRYEPGSDEFNQSLEKWKEIPVPNGAKFNDQTNMYHGEFQYNLSDHVPGVEIVTGASYRLFELNSNGTIFPDTAGNDLSIFEYGAYVQAGKLFFDDLLKISGSLRYDKNQNFDGQINPRISAVLNAVPNQSLRISYQTGFRMPTTQQQHIDLNIGAYRLLGGLPQYAAAYNVTENAYTIQSINEFTQTVFQGEPELALLEAFTEAPKVKPEQVRAFEIGYRGVVKNQFTFDLAYYYSRYLNFIGAKRVRKATGAVDATQAGILNAFSLLNPSAETFQIYTNSTDVVQSQGFAAGFGYKWLNGIELSGNYNWNHLIDPESYDPSFVLFFNTPEHKVNMSLEHRNILPDLGGRISWRWQDAFDYESSFAFGRVPAFNTVDAQVNYRFKELKTMLKLGGSNLFNQYYIQNYGGPSIGALYYVSLTFNELW